MSTITELWVPPCVRSVEVAVLLSGSVKGAEDFATTYRSQ